MAERGSGAIVNTSSFAFLGDYGGTGYPAGKGAVNSLTLAVATELAESGVRADYVAQLYVFLASDLAAGITGGIFAGSGCYVSRFDRPTPTLLAYRDHATEPPWSLDELAELVGAASSPR